MIGVAHLVNVMLLSAQSLVVMKTVFQLLTITPVFVRPDIPTLITDAHLTVAPFHTLQAEKLTAQLAAQDVWPLLTRLEPALHAHVLLDTVLLMPRHANHAKTTPTKPLLVQRNALNVRAVSLQPLKTAL